MISRLVVGDALARVYPPDHVDALRATGARRAGSCPPAGGMVES